MTTAREILILNFLLEAKAPGSVPLEGFLLRALRALRTHLAADVAFISQYGDGGEARIVHVDSTDGSLLPGAIDNGDVSPEMVQPGQRCERISAPIRLGDGTPYGWLVCAGPRPSQAYTERDMTTMRVFAEMASEHIEAADSARERERESTNQVLSVLAGDGVSCAYQPIIDIGRGEIIGVEALARFSAEPVRPPDAWFADAARAGLEIELEHKIIAQALKSFPVFPRHVSVAFNVSSNVLLQGRLGEAFAEVDLRRVVLEINEHMSFRRYDELARVLSPLRERGLRISVDDDGRGVEGFRHILDMKPDVIKLHKNLVRGIDTDPARRAVAGALVQFGKGQHCEVIGEGVESASELSALRAIGVSRMQGYYVRRPGNLDTIATLCKRQIRSVTPMEEVA